MIERDFQGELEKWKFMKLLENNKKAFLQLHERIIFIVLWFHDEIYKKNVIIKNIIDALISSWLNKNEAAIANLNSLILGLIQTLRFWRIWKRQNFFVQL